MSWFGSLELVPRLEMTDHIDLFQKGEAFRCAVCKVGLSIVIRKVILDIPVLWCQSGLPDVRGDQDPPEGGPRCD